MGLQNFKRKIITNKKLNNMIYDLFISPNLDIKGIKRRLGKKHFIIRKEMRIQNGINNELSAEYVNKYPKLHQDYPEKIKQLEMGIFLEIECPGSIPAAPAVWEMLTEVFGKKEIILCQVSEKNGKLPSIFYLHS